MLSVGPLNDITLVVQLSPGSRRVVKVGGGRETLAEILDGVDVGPVLLDAIAREPDRFSIHCNDKQVDPGRLRAKPGDLIVVKSVPGVTAAGLAVLLGGFGPGAVAIGATALTFAAFAINVGLAVGLGVLTSLIFAPKISDLGGSGRGSESLRLTGSRNRARPGERIPAPYGRNRFTPPLVAQPQSEVDLDTGNQNLRQAFLIGLGEYKVSEPRIAQTPLDQFAGNVFEDFITQDPGEVLIEPGGALGQRPRKTSIVLPGDRLIGNLQTTDFAQPGQAITLSLTLKPTPQDVSGAVSLMEILPDQSEINATNPMWEFGTLKDSSPGNAVWVVKTGASLYVLVAGESAGQARDMWRVEFPSPLVADEWQQLMVTIDPVVAVASGPAAGIKLFKDGVEVASTSSQTSPEAAGAVFSGLTVHRMFVGGHVTDHLISIIPTELFVVAINFLRATIYSTAVWGSVLPVDQQLAVWNDSTPEMVDLSVEQSLQTFGTPLYSSQPSLSAWWLFESTQAADSLTGDPNLVLQAKPGPTPPMDLVVDSPGAGSGRLDVQSSGLSELFSTLFTENIESALLEDRFDNTDPTTFTVRSSAPATVRMQVELVFNNGLVRINEAGTSRARNIRVVADYQLSGDPTWTRFSDRPIGGLFRNSFGLTVSTPALDPGIYLIRVGLMPAEPANNYTIAKGGTGGDASAITGDATWASTRSFLGSGSPFPVEGMRINAIGLQATNNLTGSVEKFNVLVETAVRYLDDNMVWHPADAEDPLSLAAGRNPAWIVIDILTGVNNSPGLSDDELDLPAFKAWADFCESPDSSGQPLTFDGVFDSEDTSVFSAASTVAAAGRASLDIRGSIISPVVDHPSFRTVPVNLFSPRNSRGLQIDSVYPERIDAVTASFVDTETNELRNLQIKSPGLLVEPTEIVNSDEFRGQTSELGLTRAILTEIASIRFRPEEFTFSTGLDGLVARRGDAVLLNHWVLGDDAQQSGRVVSVIESAGFISQVELDSRLTFEPGLTYAAVVRGETLETTSVAVVNPAGATAVTSTTLDFATPIPADSVEVGSLLVIGQADSVTERLIVKNIEITPDLEATLKCVADAGVEIDALVEQELTALGLIGA